MANENAPENVEFNIELPDDLEAGVPAEFASLWHTPTSFVIDFVVTKNPPSVKEKSNGERVQQVSAKVVSRIRIPPEQVFELAKALTQQLSAWESENGKESND